ncbi:IS66 family transposase [Dactylosporangium sp. NPDC000555]|uniref:IS66 family transposase n=1 Tax=Dactylosporangium sp. NPDC000555 TaxID=3154260 RepID=UPI003324DA42
MQRRLGLNSTNSSRPPSPDGLGRPKRVSGKASGRSKGKQPGSSGSTLALIARPDHVVEHRPDRCANAVCGAALGDRAEYARQRRQVFELPELKMVVTEHQIVAVACNCGHVTIADVPAGVSGRVQYGPAVKAAAVYARGAQFLPYARAARLLGDLAGARVSTGFVHGVFLEAAARLAPFTDRLRELLRAAPVPHADETPARLDGRWGYVHVACTADYTLFHVGGRAAADVDAGGVLPGFTGTIVRDGYAAYQHLRDATHAWCGAHLLRDLKAVHEADPAGQSWAEAMATTLLIAKQTTEQAVTDGRDALTEQEISRIGSYYAGAVAHGRAENPPDRNGDLSRAGKLVERFHTHRGMILRFVLDLAAPFTNNTAERALRPIKLQQKISATWRVLHGLAAFATVRSYLDTATKHGQDTLTVLKQLFTTGPWMPPAPSS